MPEQVTESLGELGPLRMAHPSTPLSLYSPRISDCISLIDHRHTTQATKLQPFQAGMRCLIDHAQVVAACTSNKGGEIKSTVAGSASSEVSR